MIKTLEELIAKHPGEAYTLKGSPAGLFVKFSEESYQIDSEGEAIQSYRRPDESEVRPGYYGTPEAAMEQIAEIAKAQAEADAAKAEATADEEDTLSEVDIDSLREALLQEHVQKLNVTGKFDPDGDYWTEGDPSLTNAILLGEMDESLSGNVPLRYGDDVSDYLDFFTDADGDLAVKITYLPRSSWSPHQSDEESRQAARELYDRVGVAELIDFEDFFKVTQDRKLRHEVFGEQEIHEWAFEVIEETQSGYSDSGVDPDYREAPANELFDVKHAGKRYTIYAHLHED